MRATLLGRKRKVASIYCLNCHFKLAELYLVRRYDDGGERLGLQLKVGGHYLPLAGKHFSEIGEVYERVKRYWRRCPKCYRDLGTIPQVLTLSNGKEKTTFVLYEGEVVEWKTQDLAK